jgi:rod shape determining protein RodA
MSKILFKFRGFDWVLFLSTFLLVCFGLVAIYSVTLSREVVDWNNLIKQLIAFAVGLLLFFIMTFLDSKILKSYALWLYFLGLILLLVVLFFGSTLRGTRGWFTFGDFSFQPVELVKIIAIIFLAYYFSRRSRPLNKMKYLIVSGLAIFIPFILVVLQPDFGSAIILFLIWLGFILAIGLRRYQIVIFSVGAILAFTLVWSFLFAPYQKDRIRIFLNPAADPLGAGYNVTQSVIAIGAGNWIGSGLSFGSQSQLKFLPEAQTDFVFAVIAEELGFLGVVLILGLFFMIFYRLYRLTKRCHDDFSLFLILGIMILFFCQLVMNIGMNLGLAPVTGITLPFVSYGGSSLIIMLLIMGLAESVRMRS